MATRREFRSAESYRAEEETRAIVPRFLRKQGLTNIRDERRSYGKTTQQTVRATLPTGQVIAARVKLCWHPKDGKRRVHEFSAAQFMARIKDGDWDGSIRSKLRAQRSDGITHMLIVQREAKQIRYAALLPLDAVLPIWRLQRDTSRQLVKTGALGRRTKNHAMNGASPTIWLADEQAPAVARQLWAYPGVIPLHVSAPGRLTAEPWADDDTYDDLPGLDAASLGSDGAPRTRSVRSGMRRDAQVRAVVLKRANGACEREGCGESRGFAAFLDVHHILGAAKSDRVYNCVALCPNCHREAHFAPDRQAINQSLLRVARTRSKLLPRSTSKRGGNRRSAIR